MNLQGLHQQLFLVKTKQKYFLTKYCNTIVVPVGANHCFSLRNGSTGNTVKNNILIHQGGNDSIAVDTESFTGLDSDYNIVTNIEDTTGSIVSLSS